MKLKKMFRASGVEQSGIDKEARTIEFSFSSEEPVERWFGTEILSHKPGAMDMNRLNDGAPLLWNHNPDQVIGVIESAEVKNGRGYAKARFSQNELAQEKWQDIQDGILRNISFGYQIKEMELTKEQKGKPSEYTATKYEVFEISVVSVPADNSVGIGRAECNVENEVPVINKQKDESKGVRKMDEMEIKSVETKAAQAAKDAERARTSAIIALGEKFNDKELARQLIDGEKSIDEARSAFLEKLGAKQKPVTQKEADIGMSEKEIRQYSFLKAIRAQMFPNEKKYRDEAAFELEVHNAAADKFGRAVRGLAIPVDVLRHTAKRDLVVGTSTAGGNLVATDLLSGSFIDILRNKSIVSRAGAQVMNGLVGNIAIPKQSGAATAYWVAESGAPTESQQTVAQVSMSPKTVGAYTDFSRKLMLQSSIDVENMVRSDLAQVIALEIDRAALYGLGSSNEPTGLKPALAAFNGASQEKNFAASTPTFAEIIELETKISSVNADVANMKYLINASMQGALKGKEKASGYPVYVLDGGQMNGYQTLMSNQIASGDVWFGNFADLMLGFWSGLDLLVDPYSNSTSGTIRVVALQDCDVAARHLESFARGNDSP